MLKTKEKIEVSASNQMTWNHRRQEREIFICRHAFAQMLIRTRTHKHMQTQQAETHAHTHRRAHHYTALTQIYHYTYRHTNYTRTHTFKHSKHKCRHVRINTSNTPLTHMCY